MDAIVYTSNTGFTRQYAELLSDATGLAAYDLTGASSQLPQGSAVFYLGWLKAGAIQGYRKAARRFQVMGVCAVGLADTETQKKAVRAKNRLGETPFFLVIGGYDRSRLKGLDGFLMDRMTKFLQKNAADPEHNEMLTLLKQGGNRVSRENLAPVLAWWVQEAGDLSE